MKLTKEQRIERRQRIKEKFRKFFAKIKEFFKELDDEILPKVSAIALTIMQGINKALDSPVADIITDIIPGGIDDALKQRAQQVTAEAIEKLTWWKECEQYDTLDQKIICFVEHLKEKPVDVQNAIKAQLHALILSGLDEDRKDMSEYSVHASIDYLNDKITNA